MWWCRNYLHGIFSKYYIDALLQKHILSIGISDEKNILPPGSYCFYIALEHIQGSRIYRMSKKSEEDNVAMRSRFRRQILSLSKLNSLDFSGRLHVVKCCNVERISLGLKNIFIQLAKLAFSCCLKVDSQVSFGKHHMSFFWIECCTQKRANCHGEENDPRLMLLWQAIPTRILQQLYLQSRFTVLKCLKQPK